MKKTVLIFLLVNSFLIAKSKKLLKNSISLGVGSYHTDGFEAKPIWLATYSRKINSRFLFSLNVGISTLSLSKSNRQIYRNFKFEIQKQESKEYNLDLNLGYSILSNKKQNLYLQTGIGVLRANISSFITINAGVKYEARVFLRIGIFIKSTIAFYQSDLFQIISDENSTIKDNSFFAQNQLIGGGISFYY